MAAKIITNARFCNLIDDYENWIEVNPSLRVGEFAIVKNKPEDLGVCTVGVIGTGQTFQDLLKSDNNIIYFGRGAQYQLPVAGSSLGGVKRPENVKQVGIDIKGGVITNDLISRWSTVEKCYEIDKLIVGKLICEDYTQKASFDGNYITLRNKEITEGTDLNEVVLQDGEYAGVEIKNVYLDKNGNLAHSFFGIDNKEQFYVTRNNLYYPIYPCASALFNDIEGYYSYKVENGGYTIIPPKELIFKNNYWASGTPEDEGYEETKLQKYDGGLTKALTIDITPPTMIFNGREVKYNVENNSFSFEFDENGISKEDLEKLDKLDEIQENINNYHKDIEGLQSSIDNLQDTKLEASDITITPSTSVDIKRVDNADGSVTFTVGHSNIDHTTQNASTQLITKGDNYTFITGLVIDDQGHVTSILTSTYKWN